MARKAERANEHHGCREMIGKSREMNELERKLREQYSLYKIDEKETILDATSALLEKMNSPKISLNQLLNEAVRMIHRVLEFQCVTIALKDYVDGLFRYDTFIGLTPSMENEYRKIEYSANDLLDSNSFPHIKISRFSYFFMTEDNPYKTGEEMTTFRPGQFSEMRKHPEDMLDPDYFDVFMFGNAGDIIGWIEAFNTRSGKLPKRETIRCLELIASALSAVIMAKGFERK